MPTAAMSMQMSHQQVKVLVHNPNLPSPGMPHLNDFKSSATSFQIHKQWGSGGPTSTPESLPPHHKFFMQQSQQHPPPVGPDGKPMYPDQYPSHQQYSSGPRGPVPILPHPVTFKFHSCHAANQLARVHQCKVIIYGFIIFHPCCRFNYTRVQI